MNQSSSEQQVSASRQVVQRAHSVFKANVYLEQHDGEQYIVKDYSASPTLVRNSLCRFMLNREIRTLKKLNGIHGIPHYLGPVGKHGYRMQYIDGDLPSTETMGTEGGLLEQLERIVEQMHLVGITHNDLRTTNLILSKDKQLYLIDFGAVAFRPLSDRLLLRPALWFFNYLTHTDRSKVARIKQIYRPDELTSEDLALIDRTRFARKTTRLWKDLVLPIISPAKHRKRD